MRPLDTTTARLGTVLVVLGAALLVTSSGGASSVTMDRPVSIAVAEDEDAMIGIDTHVSGSIGNETGSASADNGTPRSVAHVEVTNRMQPAIDVSPVVGPRTPVSNVADRPLSLEPGEAGTIVAAIDCDDAAGTDDVPVELTVDSDSVHVEPTVSLPDPCAGGHDRDDATASS